MYSLLLQHLISETVRSAQYLADIEDRDKEIEKLKEEISTMKEESAKVKKRNKQLAFIISQGESKLLL
jgi:cell division protein FtsB